MADRRFAYLHGFASGPRSRKGLALAEAFAARGLTMDLPDLNQPSFAKLSPEACLGAVDAMDRSAKKAGEKWSFVGSSFGGWLAARWAAMHPARVDKLVLLCPGFELPARWPVILGSERMAEWGRRGELEMADGEGKLVAGHYGFDVEALGQPGTPSVPCPTLIIHGTRDEVVPIDSSRAYAKSHDNVRLIEVDDVHDLAASTGRICDEALAFFG